MSILLFVLVSGDFLSIGLAVLGIGALEAFAYRRIGASLGLCGIVLIAASAVPLPVALYVALGFVFVVWLVLGRRSPRARLISTGLLLVVVVLVAAVFVRERGWPPSGPADERPVFVLGDSLSAAGWTVSSSAWMTGGTHESPRRAERTADGRL